MVIASYRWGATGERTDLNRGKLPSSYQVTLGGLREGDGDTTLVSRQAPTFGNRVSRRLPESQPTTGQHMPTMTLSSGMSPENLGGKPPCLSAAGDSDL
jgi:hypothetical protein